MKLPGSIALAVLINIGLLTAPLGAEEVTIPLGQQGEQSLERPPKGVSKAQVEEVYGRPQSKHGPTGEPPIYSWEYPRYTVYFEGDVVIHTVIKQPQTKD